MTINSAVPLAHEFSNVARTGDARSVVGRSRPLRSLRLTRLLAVLPVALALTGGAAHSDKALPVPKAHHHLSQVPRHIPHGLEQAIHRFLGPGPIGLGSAPLVSGIEKTVSGWKARAPRQGLSATISAYGSLSVRLAGSAHTGSFSARAIGWGRKGEFTPLPISSTLRGGRLVQQMGKLATWYRVSDGGLEEGFVVSRPSSFTGGDLVVELGSAAGWRVAQAGTSLIEQSSWRGTALVYGGLATTDANGTRVASRLAVVGGTAEIVVRPSPSVEWPLTVDPTWTTTSTPTATLTNSGGTTQGDFGISLALSADGTTAIVGAAYVSSNTGVAYVFHVAGEGSWASSSTPTATLTNSGGVANDSFGLSVAISADGTTALVGASGVNLYTGATYVFHVAGEGSWASSSTPTATLAGGAAYDFFGYSLAISADGTTAMVGANGASAQRGAAYVFHVAGEGSWASSSSPTATLTNSGGVANDVFGWSVTISADGTTALVGAIGANSNAGAAYVFHVAGVGSWASSSTPTATLTNSGGVAGDDFGHSVALSGDGTTALIGDDGVNSQAGAAYVFHVAGAGSWETSTTPTARLTNSGGVANDEFGRTVAISADGTTALIGAQGVSSRIGAAYVFHVADEGSWASSSTPTATLTNSGGAAGDFFGSSVAISAAGTTALAGAYGVSSNTGAAYTFNVPGEGLWSSASAPMATVANSGGAANDYLGYSVAISADGTTALVGAPYANSNTGAVFVFHVTGEGSWTSSSAPTATLTDSGGAPDFGNAVAISADGTTAVIGAFSGDASVFHVTGEGSWASSSTPTATLTNGATNGQFGYSVVISADGTTVVVGAPSVNSLTGAAYIFNVAGEGSWASSSVPTTTLTNPAGAANDQFGYSVSLSADGTTALVGAYQSSATGTGAAYVFQSAGEGSWASVSIPTAILTNSAGSASDYLGFPVTLSADGTTALVGAIGASSQAGAVDVFHVAGKGSWASSSTPTATLTNSGGAAHDWFGISIALSADGTTAVVGASQVNSVTGAAYVFHVVGEGSWTSSSTPTATLTNSGGTSDDNFGDSIAISADGTTALIAAFGVSSHTGAAYLYSGVAPTVTSINPSSGPTTGGSTVTIDGTNLAGAAAVDFGASNPGTISSDTSSRIVVTSPPGSLGAVDVTVATPDGTSLVSAGDHYNYVSAAGPPDAPTGVTATPGNGSATVSWVVPKDNGSAITSYWVEFYSGGWAQGFVTVICPCGSSRLSTTVRGLANGSGYTFTVTATNGVGSSPFSKPSAPATPAGAPGGPGSLAATPGPHQATVSWLQPNDNGAAITSYTVTPYIGSVALAAERILCPVSCGGARVTTMVTGLIPGKTYTFRINATNRVGTSTPSVPSAPVVPTKSTSSTALSLSLSSLVFGHEQLEVFTVAVQTGAGSPTGPTGTVAVRSGTTTLCIIKLPMARLTCSPAAKALAVGSHAIVAVYVGDANFNGSASPGKVLVVKA